VDHPYQRVIYRDSEHIWDQVVIDDACRFVRFAPLKEKPEDLRPEPAADPRALFALLLLHECYAGIPGGTS
jgi:hypothetical protein